MSFRSDFAAGDWLGLQTTFFLSWRGVAAADGVIDKQEERLRDSLIEGEEVHNLLESPVHSRLSSEPDLAREVLEFKDDDRRAFLAFIASTSDTRALAETALRIDTALPAWVKDAATEDDRGVRQRNAKGVLLEAYSFGLRTARATGARFGKKMSEVELRAIDQFGGQILELSPDDRITVFHATGGHV